jgi:hypothetical protein
MIMASQSVNSGLQGYDYYAFISYCHQDETWAKWLHEKLERYHLPAILCKEQSLPRDIKPIFRYPTDMPTDNLHKNIHYKFIGYMPLSEILMGSNSINGIPVAKLPIPRQQESILGSIMANPVLY